MLPDGQDRVEVVMLLWLELHTSREWWCVPRVRVVGRAYYDYAIHRPPHTAILLIYLGAKTIYIIIDVTFEGMRKLI